MLVWKGHRFWEQGIPGTVREGEWEPGEMALSKQESKMCPLRSHTSGDPGLLIPGQLVPVLVCPGGSKPNVQAWPPVLGLCARVQGCGDLVFPPAAALGTREGTGWGGGRSSLSGPFAWHRHTERGAGRRSHPGGVVTPSLLGESKERDSSRRDPN